MFVTKILLCSCFIACLVLTTNAFEDIESWTTYNQDDFENLLSPDNTEQVDDQQRNSDCTTPACKKLRKSVYDKMSKKHKPCNDMYMFACGKMVDEENKRKDQRDESTFKVLIEAQTKKLIKIVEGLKDREENDVYSKVYDWYAACSNTEEKQKLGSSPLLNALKSIGSWPILNRDWNEEDWDLEKMLASVHRNLSVFPLFKVSLGNNAKNESGSPYRLSIVKPTLGLTTPEFYLKKSKYADHILYAYYKLLHKLSQLMGGKDSLLAQAFGIHMDGVDGSVDDKARLMLDIIKVVKFEMDIAQAITLDKNTYLVSPYTTLGKLQNAYKDTTFDWKRYITLIYQDIPKQPPFEDDEIIYVPQVEFFERTMQLVQTTDPRVIANYMMSKILFEYGGALSEEFRSPYLEFYKVAYGIKSFSETNVRCVRSASKSLMFPVTALFVKDNLPEQDLVKAEDLVTRLKDAYLYHLKHSVEWMDNVTRQAAEEKVIEMMAHVGYPREIRNTTVLDQMYSEVQVDPLNYFENIVRFQNLQTRNTLAARGSFQKRASWDMQLTQANAEYSASTNKITVAAGLLQPPLFHRDYPRARTFGSIGMAIGHEMTHGFDAYGARFDKKGNVHLWWTNQTYKTFVNKTKCMIDQYSKFKVENEHLNGQQTLDENIADNGGIRIAYEAYCRSLKVSGPDQSLPRINLTSKQLFFLSFSQLWCKHKTKASAINSLHTDEHSPARARVNFVLQNMKEFSDTFKCPKGSPMNPEKKCVIW